MPLSHITKIDTNDTSGGSLFGGGGGDGQEAEPALQSDRGRGRGGEGVSEGPPGLLCC